MKGCNSVPKWKYKTLVNRLVYLSRKQPVKAAIIFKHECYTYLELCQRSFAIGKYLSDHGIKQGNRVLLTAVSKPIMVATYFGIQYCGAVPVFLDRKSSEST